MSKNFYNILGVNEKSTKDEIKKAYRSLQMKYHPDKNMSNPDAINMTQQINEAYEILGDEQKREEYDNARNNPNPFMRMNTDGGMDINVDDIFNMFFGGGGPFGGSMGGMTMGGMSMGGMPMGMGMGGMKGMPPGVHIFHGGPMGINQAFQKPTPIMKTIDINMEQVLSGATIPLEIERWVIENGLKIFETENIYVTVPQGIDDNEMIILRDKGNVLNENVKGDVKIFVKITNDTIFKTDKGLATIIVDNDIEIKGLPNNITFLGGDFGNNDFPTNETIEKHVNQNLYFFYRQELQKFYKPKDFDDIKQLLIKSR
jgi:DnaJ-class molecular chaperone